MIKFECDECKRPIDPGDARYIDVPHITIVYHGKIGRMANLHLCDKKCFTSWLNKHAEPSGLVTPQDINPLHKNS
jgi:hypothetical protein